MPPAAFRENRLTGIALMSGAFLAFSGLDATAKYLSGSLETTQIVWARYLGHLLFAAAWFLPSYGTALLRSANLRLQILRSLLLFAATFANFLALRYLQLSTTSAILFSMPLILAALSVPLLGERVGPRRWTAIVVGFVGVLVIVRPGLGIMHWAVGLSLLSATCGALYNITTRRLAGIDPAPVTHFYSALVGALVATPFAPFVWTAPALPLDWLLLGGTGLLGGFGHYLLILAHRHAPAPILAPFVYQQILYMVALGYLVFGDLPDRWVIVGASIVIGSGLYLWYRERRVKAAQLSR